MTCINYFISKSNGFGQGRVLVDY